ncbi:hypothetical protein HPP92_016951 [Vanilla planifolia]|uniref:FAM91 N-terminal domain-containing protein n=1 Tax=Vanilla planifolia TaxID=51239 RepID=A0A835QG54_VANPL|nr:hypothetical protein HPP92_016951 [Vanilla planifolia]
MQRVHATIEEQLILKSIKEECLWENLPKRLQLTISTKEEWHRRIIEHCIKKRLQWNACFARKVCKEGEYYEEMMRYLPIPISPCRLCLSGNENFILQILL